MEITGVWSTAVRVDDVAAAVRWYREVLGLWPPDEGPPDALDAGDHRVAFASDPQPSLSLGVADLAAAVQELRGRGVPVTELPAADGLAAQLTDPWGNTVQLVQPALADPALLEQGLTSFIDAQADLDGPPTDELADRVDVLVQAAQEALGALMDGVAHNKVLATQLLIGQRARQADAGTAEQCRLYAASTLLSHLVVPP